MHISVKFLTLLFLKASLNIKIGSADEERHDSDVVILV